MKKFISGLLVGALLFTGISVTASTNVKETTLKFFFNGEEKSLSYGEAMNVNGRTYVPLRDVAEWMDTPLYWNSTTISIGTLYSEIVNSNGEVLGGATFTQEDDGVKILISVEKLTPGKHGFHIHAQPFTGNDFKTAAGHFNPENKKHGHLNPEGHHMGDMPNIEVKEDGTVETEVLVEGVTLEPGKVNSILGKSLIIHAAEDDGMSDPAGNAGDRVAGGNIGY